MEHQAKEAPVHANWEEKMHDYLNLCYCKVKKASIIMTKEFS